MEVVRLRAKTSWSWLMARNCSRPICPAWRTSQTWTTGPMEPAVAVPERAARTMSSISSWLSTFSMRPPVCGQIQMLKMRLCSSGSFGASAGRGGQVQEIEPRTQTNHGKRMNLGNPRFANAEGDSDFLHGEFVVVVKRENALFLIRQFGDGILEQMLRLRAEALEEGCFLGLGWDVVGEIFFFAVARRLDAQAAEFKAVQLSEQGLQFLKLDAHLLGDFMFVGGASEFSGKLGIGGVDQAAFAPQFARAPVEFAEIVEDSAADAELGIRTELHVLREIELIEGVDKPDDAGMDQVFEGHVAGQPVVNAAGDVTDLGKLFHEYPLAVGVGLDALIGVGGMFGHEAGPAFVNRVVGR